MIVSGVKIRISVQTERWSNALIAHFTQALNVAVSISFIRKKKKKSCRLIPHKSHCWWQSMLQSSLHGQRWPQHSGSCDHLFNAHCKPFSSSRIHKEDHGVNTMFSFFWGYLISLKPPIYAYDFGRLCFKLLLYYLFIYIFTYFTSERRS